MKITKTSGCLYFGLKINNIDVTALTNDNIVEAFKEFTEKLNSYFKDDATSMISFMEEFTEVYGNCTYMSKEPCESCGDTSYTYEVDL